MLQQWRKCSTLSQSTYGPLPWQFYMKIYVSLERKSSRLLLVLPNVSSKHKGGCYQVVGMGCWLWGGICFQILGCHWVWFRCHLDIEDQDLLWMSAGRLSVRWMWGVPSSWSVYSAFAISHVPCTVTSLQQAYQQADCAEREFIKIFWYVKGISIYNLQEFPKQMDSAQHIHPDTSFWWIRLGMNIRKIHCTVLYHICGIFSDSVMVPYPV